MICFCFILRLTWTAVWKMDQEGGNGKLVRPGKKYMEETRDKHIMWKIVSVGLGNELDVTWQKEWWTREDSQTSNLMVSFIIWGTWIWKQEGIENFKKYWLWDTMGHLNLDIQVSCEALNPRSQLSA